MKYYTVFVGRDDGESDFIYHLRADNVKDAEVIALKEYSDDLREDGKVEAVILGWIKDIKTDKENRWTVNEWMRK